MMKGMNLHIQNDQEATRRKYKTEIQTEIHNNQWWKPREKRTLKALRGKQLIKYKKSSIRLIIDFSSNSVESNRDSNDIFKFLKETTGHPRILY